MPGLGRQRFVGGAMLPAACSLRVATCHAAHRLGFMFCLQPVACSCCLCADFVCV
jgi:hypothetical protein